MGGSFFHPFEKKIVNAIRQAIHVLTELTASSDECADLVKRSTLLDQLYFRHAYHPAGYSCKSRTDKKSQASAWLKKE